MPAALRPSKVFARCAAAQAKFSSTFSKRWQIPKAAPLAAIRRWRNTPYFRRIWGFGGLYKRKAPKAPPFYAHLGGKRPPRWGGGPAGARGGPSFVFAACGRPAGSPLSFFLLEFSGIPADWLPLEEGEPLLRFPGIPPEGLSGPAPTGGSLSCAGKKVTKETAGGLCRPPGPQALSFETCGRSWPSA